MIVVIVGAASITALGIDATYSSHGTGVVVQLETITVNGNSTTYLATIASSHGNITSNLNCHLLKLGETVQYDYDLFNGYVLVGTLPDGCTFT